MLVKSGAGQQLHELLQHFIVVRGQKAYLDDNLTPLHQAMRAKLSCVFKPLRFYKRPCFNSSALCLLAVAMLHRQHE